MYCTNKRKIERAVTKLNKAMGRADLVSAIFDEMFSPDDNVTWIEEWLALWPASITSGGKLVKSTPRDCTKKMKDFVHRTGFSKDEIFKATEKYLEKKANDGWAYTTCATYFIDKRGKGSALEEYCNNLNIEDFGEAISTYESSDFI